MKIEDFNSFLKQMPVIAILRGITPDEVIPVCDILREAGILLLEIPLNTQDALHCIRIAADHCRGVQLTGAGTVLDPREPAEAAAAGAAFLISPDTNPAVIRAAKEADCISIPGFFTATEAFQAIRAGADYLKLFPACLGPGYIKDLKAVIRTPILAVGGVHTDSIPDFLKVCAGVGIGSGIFKPGMSLDKVRKNAQSVKDIIFSRFS